MLPKEEQSLNPNFSNNYKQTQNIKKLQKQQTELQNFLKQQQEQPIPQNEIIENNSNSFKSPQTQKTQKILNQYTPIIQTEKTSQNSVYQDYTSKEIELNYTIHNQNFLESKPLVQKNQYSLEPDMINGWKPKKKHIQKQSGPIPLQLDNYLVDLIIYKLETEKNQNPYHNNQQNSNTSSTPIPTICYIGYRPKSSQDFYDILEENKHKNQIQNQFDFPLVYKEWLENVSTKKPSSYADKLYKDYYENNPEKLRNYGDGKYKSGSENMVNYITKQKIQDRKVDFTGKNEKIYKNSKYISKNYSSQFLEFDSLFESGNLDLAVRVGEYEYDLFMRVDTNSRGHTHWYYFQIQGMQSGKSYTFNICNFTKTRTLYERGMRPFVFSKLQNQRNNKKWQQQGQNVSYQPSSLKNYQFLFSEYEINNHYYTMKFEYTAQDSGDTVSFAYSVPYSYSKLLKYFKTFEDKKNIVEISTLTKSLSNLNIPLLTITDFNTPNTDKKIIAMQARIHPGEANSSYVMQGIINHLISKDEQMQEIRKKVIFKIVPMLNVDGVVFGNYRCSSAGKDLNRMFIYNDQYREILYPEIKGIKTMLQEEKTNKKDIIMFLDLHGHSQRKNVFIYGPNFPIYDLNYYKCRLFPKLISQKTEMFRYFSCLFRISPGKEKTARAEILRAFSIVNTFTIESSNGQYYSEQQVYDFTAKLWKKMGKVVAESIDQYLTQMFELIKILEERQQKILQQQQNNNNNSHNTISNIPQPNSTLPYTFVRQSSKNFSDNSNSNRKSQTKCQSLISLERQNEEESNSNTIDKYNKESEEDQEKQKFKKSSKSKSKNKNSSKSQYQTPNKNNKNQQNSILNTQKNTKKIYSSPDKKSKPQQQYIKDLLKQTPFEDLLEYINHDINIKSENNLEKIKNQNQNLSPTKKIQIQNNDSDDFSGKGSDSEESDEDLNLKDQESLQQQILIQCKGSSKNSALITPTKKKNNLFKSETPKNQTQKEKNQEIDQFQQSGSKKKKKTNTNNLFQNKILKKQSKSFYNPDTNTNTNKNTSNEKNSLTQQNFQKSFTEKKNQEKELLDKENQNEKQQQYLNSSIKYWNYPLQKISKSPNNQQNKSAFKGSLQQNIKHKRLLSHQKSGNNSILYSNNQDQQQQQTQQQNISIITNNIINNTTNNFNNYNNLNSLSNTKSTLKQQKYPRNFQNQNQNQSQIQNQNQQNQQYVNFNSTSVIIQQYPILNSQNQGPNNNSLKEILEKNFEKQKQQQENIQNNKNNNNINKDFEINYAALQKQQEQIRNQYSWSPVKPIKLANLPKRQSRCITVNSLNNNNNNNNSNNLSKSSTITQQQQEQFIRQRNRIISYQQLQQQQIISGKYPKLQQNQQPIQQLTQQQLQQAYKKNSKNSQIQFVSQNELDLNCFSDQTYKEQQHYQYMQKIQQQQKLLKQRKQQKQLNSSNISQEHYQVKNQYVPKSQNNLEFEQLIL